MTADDRIKEYNKKVNRLNQDFIISVVILLAGRHSDRNTIMTIRTQAAVLERKLAIAQLDACGATEEQS